MQFIPYIILYTGLGVSVYTDYKYRKIKNFVVFPMMVCGIFLSFLNGIHEGVWAFFSIIITFLVVTIACLTGMLGYGDKKMFCAISALMGYKFGLYSLIASLISMLLYMVITHPKKTFNIFVNFFRFIKLCVMTKAPVKYGAVDSEWHVPFAYFITTGVIIINLLSVGGYL